MIFSSVLFLVYFLPVFFTLYFVIPKNWRNIYLLISSVFFYSWGAPRFIFVILGTTLLDFILVKKMDEAKRPGYRSALLLLSVCMNLGLLVYFKYSNFFIENINHILHALSFKEIRWTKLLLPIGISFYTFETITYVVDVYRRIHKPQTNFWNYQLYIIFFPKLIAGPIVRYHEFADQISNRFYQSNFQNLLAGIMRFSIGLGKKVLIANQCGSLADEIMGMNIDQLNSFSAWLGIFAYTMQIYFDFSGYSDMAIGLSRMMGFKIPENFNNPYTSTSITDFWRRWHITLGSWMRNYLYIPLGGSKVESRFRLYFNLFLVFLASGFWHGASWNFIFWGVYHGVFLVIERAFLLNVYKGIGNFIKIPVTFLIVMIGWVYFRIESFSDATLYVTRLFSDFPVELPEVSGFNYFYLSLALVFSFFTITSAGKRLQTFYFEPDFSIRASAPIFLLSAAILIILSVAAVSSAGFNPFIYFRF